jgi:hypothetical protein
MPLLEAKGIGWQRRLPATSTRSAALVRRDIASPVLRFLQIGAWVLWGMLTLATVILLRQNAVPQWWLLSFTLMGAVELALGGWLARQAALEPEPLDPAGSAKLQEAYARLRRLKHWSWHAGTTLGMLLFTGAALLVAWDEIGNLVVAIWIGAGGGSLLGLAGAVVGVSADLQRARINRHFRELTSQRQA